MYGPPPALTLADSRPVRRLGSHDTGQLLQHVLQVVFCWLHLPEHKDEDKKKSRLTQVCNVTLESRQGISDLSFHSTQHHGGLLPTGVEGEEFPHLCRGSSFTSTFSVPDERNDIIKSLEDTTNPEKEPENAGCPSFN